MQYTSKRRYSLASYLVHSVADTMRRLEIESFCSVCCDYCLRVNGSQVEKGSHMFLFHHESQTSML